MPSADALEAAGDFFDVLSSHDQHCTDRTHCRRPTEGTECRASKTSTARSSSTTTAAPGTGVSCRSPPAHRVEGFNPLCGDEIVVYLDVEGDTVTDVKIGGQGCSISQSSASMMSAAVKGKTIAEVRALTRAFKSMMSIEDTTADDAGTEPPADVKLGDLEALRGVARVPVRIKCATLSWNTLAQGLDEAEQAHEV